MFDSHQLIKEAQSPNDDVRRRAETHLLELCDRDASLVFLAFMGIAMNSNEILSGRQFALYSLKKLITMYWSPGFESYRSCSNLKEETKERLRDSLLELCLDDAQITKLKNAASYCVVQISAVDFPDQWPRLLTVVYDGIINRHSLSAMSLLNEIYDDVMTEEMFFDEGIGLETIRIVFQLSRDSDSSLEAKLASFTLFHSCLTQMLTVNSSSSSKRKDMVIQSAKGALDICGEYLQNHSIVEHPLNLPIRARIYEDLALLKTEFPKKMFPEVLYAPFKELALIDLETAGKMYLSILQGYVEDYQLNNMNECVIHMIEFLTSICNFPFTSVDMEKICTALANLCCLDNESITLWLDDFNSYISMESGLTASFSIRDQTSEFLTTIDGQNYDILFGQILHNISLMTKGKQDWKSQESLLYLLQSLVGNETMPSENIVNQIREVIAFLGSFLCAENSISFVRSRLILTVPKLLEKFMDDLEDVKLLTSSLLAKSIEIALSTEDDIIKASVLITFTYYSYFAELPSVLGRETCLITQERILNLITQVSQNAEDDTDGVLLEVLNNTIDCNTIDEYNAGIRQTQFNLVLSLSAKDPSNLQTVVESEECLEKLLDNLHTSQYNHYVESCLPSFLEIIDGSAQSNYTYSPILSLVLQFVTIVTKKKPNDGLLPPFICGTIFKPLQKVLLQSEDDEIIQLATEAFSYLVYNTDVTVMAPLLESTITILDRLLSFEVSDVAAMHVGSLIVTIFTRFSGDIQNMMALILQAATNRLIQAKNISTCQNLLSVFCYLTSVDAQQTVDFLDSMQLEDVGSNGLHIIMEKWLEAFEVIRGERRAKENTLALIKIYLLDDPRLIKMKVNGDIIPYEDERIITRSMAKTMPDRYTQISVYAKIIKLFVAELGFLEKQPKPERFITSDLRSNEEDHQDEVSDDEWEDVDDVLDYEKLQEYVEESDQEDEGMDFDQFFSEEGEGTSGSHSIKDILVSFFKEVAAKNISGFQDIYSSLTEVEKRTLSDNLV